MNDWLAFLAAIATLVVAVVAFFFWLLRKQNPQPDDWSNLNDHQ